MLGLLKMAPMRFAITDAFSEMPASFSSSSAAGEDEKGSLVVSSRRRGDDPLTIDSPDVRVQAMTPSAAHKQVCWTTGARIMLRFFFVQLSNYILLIFCFWGVFF